jgi:hypothetical protein
MHVAHAHGPRVALVIAIALALAGCPSGGGAPGVKGPGDERASKDDTGAAAGKHKGTDKTGGRAPAGALELPDAGIPCAVQACMYHAGADAYHLCLNSGAGTCFHYGRACAPSHQCMYDAGSASYRTCSQAGEGRCLAFGAACEPPGRCMFNRDDGMHHVCEQIEGGKRAVCDEHELRGLSSPGVPGPACAAVTSLFYARCASHGCCSSSWRTLACAPQRR